MEGTTPPNISPKREVMLRMVRGRKAATYASLIDVNEVEGLTDAYLALLDERVPADRLPPPLTSNEFKHYVRLVYNAIKSTDAASDAFEVNPNDGNTRKTFAMAYIDSIGMFEVQLVAGQLVKAAHRAQSGIYTMPAWTRIPNIGFQQHSTFPERMNKIIEALKARKLFGWSMFVDPIVTMEKRLALAPIQEIQTERNIQYSNGNPVIQLLVARSILPDGPAAKSKNDSGNKDVNKDAHKDAHKDGDKDEGVVNSGTPAPASKKRKHSNAETALTNPGESSYNTPAAKKQSTAAAAAALANASTSAKNASPAALSSDVASTSVQPAALAAPTGINTAGSARSATPAGAASTPASRARLLRPALRPILPRPAGVASVTRPVNQQTTLQDAAAIRASCGRFDAKYLASGPSHQQYYLPPPDYQASQRATQAYQQAKRPGGDFIAAAQGLGVEDSNYWQTPEFLAELESFPTNYQLEGSSHYGQQPTTRHQAEGGEVHFNGPAVGMPLAQMNTGSVFFTSGGAVNNYIQPHSPSQPGDQAHGFPSDGNSHTVDYYFGPNNSQSHEGNHASFQRDNPLPPQTPANSPQEAHTAGPRSQQQVEEDGPSLPLVAERNAPAARTASGWGLDLAGEDPTDATAIEDCRRAALGLRPTGTRGWQQEAGEQAAAARHAPVAGPSASAPWPWGDSSPDIPEQTFDEARALHDWHRINMGLYPVHTGGWQFQADEPDTPYAWTGPPQAGDGFVPFREASEEYEYDFKEEARNKKKNNGAGDKPKAEKGHVYGARAAAAGTQAKPFTAKITRLVYTQPSDQAQDGAGVQDNQEQAREEGSQAARPAANAPVRVPTLTSNQRIHIRRARNNVNNDAGEDDEPAEEGEDGPQAAPEPAASRTPTKRYRINPRLGP
ncbi:hypothetical protein KVR01_009152 [Diaporthe batatas]|uniref:uncharacterized protein n=1 Tax=Diaporthe batatas TaxID=748121 RepID=UPI001D0365B4|nr:uncharacterized protein KVR01_009152 [Diaporthe batatas]KAG8160888.1 hypothetical protein KVR01_009152 [Diaporthe batatas]